MPRAKKEAKEPRRRAEVDYDAVIRWAFQGYKTESMARQLGVHPNTVTRWRQQDPEFAAAEARGHEWFRDSLRSVQRHEALVKRNPTMLVWLGKVELGQSEKLTLPTGEVVVKHQHDFTGLSKTRHVATVIDTLRQCGALEDVLRIERANGKDEPPDQVH